MIKTGAALVVRMIINWYKFRAHNKI